MAEFSEEVVNEALEAIEKAKATGKIKKGTNEVTKAIERGTAKLVAVAKDANPAEIVMHIPLICKEKGVLCVEVPSKEDLGASAGIDVSTASVAVTQEGEAKKTIASLQVKLGADAKEEAPAEESKEEKAEEPAEEKKEEPKEEKPAKEEKKEE